MGKLYGGRWRIVGARLGQGGQSEVFRATDESRALEGEYALKRVLNPARHDRFRAEVDAIRKLKHPNIIALVDHSALEVSEGDEERQYLVMPIAAGGSLADPGRVALYKGNIEGTLQVALQLASALAAAHAAGVIHRDVKPANVLFTGDGHVIWLSDFGICLIREAERHTRLDEIVGPRSFMAPELEAGGLLEVAPSADVYSFGKVIYYMISGGTTLPREELSVPRFAQLFERGDRYRQLQLLLTRMVCPLERRLKSVTDVTAQLNAIEAWERTAVSLALDPTARDGIARLQGLALRNAQAAEASAVARASRDELLARVRQSFLSWAEVELKKLAAHIATPQISVSVIPVQVTNDETSFVPLSGTSRYEVLGGWVPRRGASDSSAGVNRLVRWYITWICAPAVHRPRMLLRWRVSARFCDRSIPFIPRSRRTHGMRRSRAFVRSWRRASGSSLTLRWNRTRPSVRSTHVGISASLPLGRGITFAASTLDLAQPTT